jgi:nanoRNase/pAp phosphatase (c-di-AMP/oligoRNAs hydrolase)
MIILYHKDCYDGFTAAWLLHKIYPDAKYIPVQYSDPVPASVAGQDVIIVDFSYKRNELEAIKFTVNSLLVLDHHETAAKNLEGLDYCIFDLNKSGARLVQEHFNIPNHWLVDYTEDRDLWRWALPNSKEVNAYIRQTNFDFAEFDKLAALHPETAAHLGTEVLRVENKIINTLVSKAEEVEFDGYKILKVNSPLFQSEIGNILAEGRPFSMVYFTNETHTIYSLRSNKDGIRVNDVAVKHGGGGHPHAAGFKVEHNEIRKCQNILDKV